MRPYPQLRRATLAATMCALSLCGQGKISWETDLGAALAKAKAENKPIMACFSMQGERVCDVIIAEHYTDKRLLELSKHTVNLFCSPHGTAAQRELEKRVRIDLLKGDDKTWMVAPQHVVFLPDGKLVWAVPYYMTAGELEWMWAEAIRKVDEKFAWEPTDRYRAPRALAAKIEAAEQEQAPPPTPAEIKAILKEIKRGFGGYYGAKEKLPIITRSDNGKAKDFVERMLLAHDTSESSRISILGVIAQHASRDWWRVAMSVLADDSPRVRQAAAECLRDLGEKRAVSKLVARWHKEDKWQVCAAILHAAVACGPTHTKVTKLLPSVLDGHEDERLRAQAAIAIASLDNKKVVHASLTKALQDASPRVRSTAAWAIASRRDRELEPALKFALDGEQDAGARKWLGKAADVLDGKGMEVFEGFPEIAAAK